MKQISNFNRKYGLNKLLHTVAFVGGGNGTHVGAAISGLKDTNVRILTRKADEWNDKLKITFPDGQIRTTKPMEMISSSPSEIIPGSDLVIVSSPVHSYPEIFDSIIPHLNENASVGVLFGQSHVGLMAKQAMEKYNMQTQSIFSLKFIPWQAKTFEYGKHAHLVGSKNSLEISTYPSSAFDTVSKSITELFDMDCVRVPFISQALTTSNQILHPARYFNEFSKSAEPLTPSDNICGEGSLYTKMDGPSAAILAALDSEIIRIKDALEEEFPAIDFTSVKPCKERVLEQYEHQIDDTRTLKTVFNTAKMYRKSKFAVLDKDGGVVPNTEHRHFQDDIPFGLCVVKDIAERMEIKVPIIDHMIMWHQDQMDKEYTTGDEFQNLNGKDLGETGILSSYGVEKEKRGLVDFLMMDFHPKKNNINITEVESLLDDIKASGREPVFVFDVDKTLWSFTAEECDNFNSSDVMTRMHPDVKDILSFLKAQNITMTLASRTWEPEKMTEYLSMAGIEMDLFDMPQLYPTGLGRYTNTDFTRQKIKHFQELGKHFELENILFFDDDEINLQTATEMNITSISTRNGLQWEHIIKALKKFK
jgi:HAD superfamily phosphatase (TIGR01681 family)